MSEPTVITLVGGPLDGQTIIWPTRALIRFGDSVYCASMRSDVEMAYIGEASSKYIQKQVESSHHAG